jgi:hypothetical protein
MFQTKVVEKIKTHILCSIFFFEKCAVYAIGLKNIVVLSRPQTKIWRMRIACWITKAKHTHTKYVKLIVFRLLQSLGERASILRYTHITCLEISNWNTMFLCKPKFSEIYTLVRNCLQFRSFDIRIGTFLWSKICTLLAYMQQP